MNIFNKRPLGLILCIILGGFSLFPLFSALFKSIAICLALILCLLAFILRKFTTNTLKIASIALILSFLISLFYFQFLFYPTDIYSEECEITGKVVDCEKKSDYYQSLDVKTSYINGDKREYKIKLNLYSVSNQIDAGSIIKFKTKINELETDSNFNYKQYYTSRGFSATATATECEIIRKESPPLSYTFKLMRENICHLAEEFSDGKAAAMLGALLLGDRDMLSGQTELDFLRTGITHILALSGTHLTLFAAAIERLLYLFRVKRKYRILSICGFSLFFMALTGFPLSVCRAGVMLIISSLLFLITGCKDGITSLSVASFAIIAVTPYASQDIGLWLSILATAGILIAAEMLNREYSEIKGVKRILKYVSMSFVFSFFAISATAIITGLNFGGISPISALTTLIFSVLVEIYLYIGILTLIFGNFIPFGKLLIFGEKVISDSVAFFADLPFVYASTCFTAAKALFIVLGVMFMVFAICEIKYKKAFISSLIVVFICAHIIPVGLTENKKQEDSIIVTSTDSDRIIIKSDGYVLLFDASHHSKSEEYYNNYLLADERIVNIDCYMIANYSSYLPDGLEVLLSNNAIKEIKLPMPRNYTEEKIAIETFKVINKYRTVVSFYEDLEITYAGEYEILVPYRAYKNNSLAVTFKKRDEIYTYFSSGILEYMPFSNQLLIVSDYMIFGNFGDSYSNQIRIDEIDKKLKSAVVFDRNIEFDLTDHEWEKPKLYFRKEKFVFK